MSDIKRLNHVAVVVEDLDEAIVFWQDHLGLSLDHVETISSMDVRIAFFPLGESKIELVQPLNEDSGLMKYLKKHGPGLHHICIEVENLAAKLDDLKEKGIRLIDDEPITMDNGRKLAFLHPKAAGGVLIEMYELP
jgi:methylmalonyl-CoA/ethylmalonyl-CoA epimerase